MEENKKSYEDLEMELAISQEAEAKAKEVAEDAQKQMEASAVEVNELNEKLDDLKKLNADLKKENAKLNKKPAAAEKEKFEFEGKTYELLVGAVHIPGKGRMTALEIASDGEAQAALVKSGSHAIKELA